MWGTSRSSSLRHTHQTVQMKYLSILTYRAFYEGSEGSCQEFHCRYSNIF
jgi:hypothetical protein